MKIDRLLGITIYLLNRQKVSARALAEHFEVSKRTIQRDIEALSMAGIPIVSAYGAGGGYCILNSFKMERQSASDSDYQFILTALKGLSTAYKNPRLNVTLEKITSVASPNATHSDIVLDFGALHEKDVINKNLAVLENFISERKPVLFYYTNADNVSDRIEAEPLILTYKWYSWYLFAFCNAKKDYRLYKLCRMSQVAAADRPFCRQHKNTAELLARYEVTDKRKYMDIKLLCKAEIKVESLEYLNGKVERKFKNGDFIMNLHLPQNERLWFGTLLALGNRAVVLEPEKLKMRLCSKAKEILDTYQ